MTLREELGLQTPFKDIRHEAVLNIVRTATLASSKAAQLFRNFDLTEAQFNVLFALKFTDGDITQAELGKRLVVTRASITSVLDKLESKGLVKRKSIPGNRRAHHVEMTEKGRALIDEVEPSYRDEIHRALTDLSDDDCRVLIHSLEQTRARIRRMLRTDAERTAV